MKTFTTVWIGQVLSQVGSTMTGFALSIFVYQQSGSVTQLGIVLLAANLPPSSHLRGAPSSRSGPSSWSPPSVRPPVPSRSRHIEPRSSPSCPRIGSAEPTA